MPPGLGTWIDIHSSADPVANGPTNISEGSAKPSSWKVWNFGALLYDHTGYWQNVDGFVLRIARICAQTAESKWINALPQNQDKIDKRSEFRTQWLHRIGRFLLVMWVVIGISLWIQHKEAIPHLLPLPEWIKFQSDNLIRFLVLLGFLFVSMWLTYNVARLIWMFWVRKEQNIFLAHQIPADFQSVPVVGMIMIVGLVIVFAFILITKTTAEIRAIQVTVEDMKVYLAMLITFSAFMYYIFFHSGKEFKRKLEEIDSSVKPN